MVYRNASQGAKARGFMMALLLVFTSACASKPAAPPHYATLQDYFMAQHSDLTTYYRHADPAKLMQCYGESATRGIPQEIRADVLTVANKSVAGEALTSDENDLKAQWLDARPRPEGNNILNVETPRALDIVRDMAVTCMDVIHF